MLCVSILVCELRVHFDLSEHVLSTCKEFLFTFYWNLIILYVSEIIYVHCSSGNDHKSNSLYLIENVSLAFCIKSSKICYKYCMQLLTMFTAVRRFKLFWLEPLN